MNDNETNKHRDITLNEPVKTYINQIDRIGKDDIIDLLRPFSDFLKRYKFEVSKCTRPVLKNDFSKLYSISLLHSLRKENLTFLYGALTSSLDNIITYMEASPEIRKAWEVLLHTDSISNKEFSNLLGRNLVYSHSYRSYTDFIEPLFFPITLTITTFSYFNNYIEYSLSLKPEIRRYILEYYHGKDFLKSSVFESLPDKTQLKIVNFEENIDNDLIQLEGLAMTRQLLTEKGSITSARVKKIRNSGMFKDFPQVNANSFIDRIEVLAYPFSLHYANREKKKTTKPLIETWAKYVAQEYYRTFSHTQIAVFFPEYTGITKTWANEPQSYELISNLNPIITASAQGWLSLDKLWLNFLCFPIDKWSSSNIRHLFNSTARSRHTLKLKGEDSFSRGADGVDWAKKVDFKFMIRWIQLLCAAGLLELAIDPNADSDDSCGGIRYIRLTPLGAFAFGLKNKYEAKKAKIDFEYDYDDRNNILTVLTPNSPYCVFLSKIGKKIGGNRFVISPEIFVKNSNDIKEVEFNMESLKRIIDIKAHPGLEKILSDVMSRINCHDALNNEYVLFKIRKDLPLLADFIRNNREIREKVVLAEKSIVLIQASFVDKFKRLCHNEGYII